MYLTFFLLDLHHTVKTQVIYSVNIHTSPTLSLRNQCRPKSPSFTLQLFILQPLQQPAVSAQIEIRLPPTQRRK